MNTKPQKTLHDYTSAARAELDSMPPTTPSREELLQTLERRINTQSSHKATSSKKTLLSYIVHDQTVLITDVFQRLNTILRDPTTLNIGFATCVCLFVIALALITFRWNIAPQSVPPLAQHFAKHLAQPRSQHQISVLGAEQVRTQVLMPQHPFFAKQRDNISSKIKRNIRPESSPNLASQQMQNTFVQNNSLNDEMMNNGVFGGENDETENILSPLYHIPKARIGAEPWATIQGIQFDFTRPAQERTAQSRPDELCVHCPIQADTMPLPELLYGMEPANIFRF
jgi:hypothetical protein